MKSTKKAASELNLLVCTAGLGLGNATRLGAIIEALAKRAESKGVRFQCTVFSWGRAVSYFAKLGESLPVECIRLAGYESGRKRDKFSGLGELRALPLYLGRYIGNTAQIRRWISSHRPDLILLDSDYHLAGPRPGRMPIVFLGQAHEVIRYSRSQDIRARGLQEKFSKVIFERLDAWLQRRIADRVLVPCLKPTAAASSRRLLRVEPIVRSAFRDGIGAPSLPGETAGKVAVMTGGSGIGSDALLHWAHARGYAVFSGQDADCLEGSGRSLKARLSEFGVLVVQGGLSSISEGVALGRPLMVVPIPDRFEQKCNALQVEHLGLGLVCVDPEKNGDAVLEKLLGMPPVPRIPCGGAMEVAEFLFEQGLDQSRPRTRIRPGSR